MTMSFDDAGKYGKEMMDTGLKSFAAVTRNLQTVMAEASDYTRKSFEQGTSALEQLIAARSPEKAFEVQSDYARSAYEAFVAQATRMGDLYAGMAKDAYKPFETMVAKGK